MERIAQYVNPETRSLLALMKFRVIGVLHSELLTNPVTEKTYRILLETAMDDQMFASHAGKLFATSTREATPARRIAPRLLPELVSILWAQVVDWLVDRSSCELKHFGVFRVNRASGTTHVDFTPSLLVTQATSEEAPAPLNSTYQSESLIHKLCHPAVISAREELLRCPDFGSISDWRLPLIGISVITIALDAAWMIVLANPELAPELQNDTISVLAMTTSVVAYYAWLIAFGLELQTRSELNMPGIGHFRRTELQVDFTPAASFLTLLTANLPPLVKGRAA